MTEQFDASREEEFREYGGTLDTDSPETEAKSDEQIAGSAYPGEEVVVDSELAQAGPYASVIRGLVDVRSQLQRNPYGGPTARRPLSQKNGGVIIHYAGPAQNRSLSALARLKSYASYHCRANGFGAGATGNGLMYHIGIAEDGTKYLCRDIEEDRWHCGAWPYNGTALAINIPIGEGQTPTAEQYRAVTEIVNDWLAYQKQSRAVVRGHKEVGASACPGTIIMNGSVYPLRQGQNPGGGSKPTPKYEPNAKYNLINPRTEWSQKRVDTIKDVVNGAAGKTVVDGITDKDKARAVSDQVYDSQPVGKLRLIAVGAKSLDMLSGRAKEAVGKYGPDTSDILDGRFEAPLYNSVKELIRTECRGDESLLDEYSRRVGWWPKAKEPEPVKPSPKPEPKPPTPSGPLTLNQLASMYDVLSRSEYEKRLPGLNEAMNKYGITTKLRMAAFLGQIAAESACLKYVEEIASGAAYEGRKDLGNTQRGDGVRFKGRGYIQLTGRFNYAAASKAFGVDFVANPSLVSSPRYAALVSGWFWNSRNLNVDADKGNAGWPNICYRVNGRYPANGQAARDRYYSRAWEVLNGRKAYP